MMDPWLLTLLTFGAVVTGITGVYSLVSDLYLRDRTRVSERVDDEFRRKQRKKAEQSQLFRDLEKLSSLKPGDLPAATLRTRVELMIEQAAVDLTPESLLGISLVAGAVLGGILAAIRMNYPAQAAILGVVGAAIGLVAPFLVVSTKRKARLAKLLQQLPDAFDLMSRVVRAGQTSSQAMLAVAQEFPQPIAGEFSLCYEQQNLGLTPEMALRDLARRTGLLEINIFVTALLVQQQTGGNLTELLDKLSYLIRQRAKLRGHVMTLTAEGRLQAIILLSLPIMLFFVMFVINPSYAQELLDHPSLIAVTVGFEAVGAFWIRKIVNFDV